MITRGIIHHIYHLHIVHVKVGRRLVEGNKSVEQKLSVSSLEEDTQHLEAVADRLVDVEARADRFVPRNLGVDADGRGGVASEVLHSDGLKPDAVHTTAGGSNLSHFPAMGMACSVRLVCTSRDDVVRRAAATVTSSDRSSFPDPNEMRRSAGGLSRPCQFFNI